MKILLLSDIHANADALEAVLISSSGMFTGILCLGDITGYGPDPEECVLLLESLRKEKDPCYILSGNHDAALSGKIPLSWFNESVRSSIAFTQNALSSHSLEWLESLPSSVKISESILAVHGSPLEPLTGYLFGGYETIEALSFLADSELDLCFCGHTHDASVFSAQRHKLVRLPAPGESISLRKFPLIVNPGSTGFPRSFNGGRTVDMSGSGLAISEACYPAYYALWDTEERSVTFLEARYDRRPVENRIEQRP